MKKLKIISLIIFSIALIVFAVYVITKNTANPAAVHVSQVSVNEEVVVLEKVSFAGSAMWYVGYVANFADGVLSIDINVREAIRFPFDKFSPFTIVIPNNYDNIREVRLSGGSQFQDRVIWTSV